MPLAKQLRSVTERGDVQEVLAEQLACQRDHLGDIKDGSGYRDLGTWGRNVDNLPTTYHMIQPFIQYDVSMYLIIA